VSALLKDILFLLVVRVSRDWPDQMDAKEKGKKNNLTINISKWGFSSPSKNKGRWIINGSQAGVFTSRSNVQSEACPQRWGLVIEAS